MRRPRRDLYLIIPEVPAIYRCEERGLTSAASDMSQPSSRGLSGADSVMRDQLRVLRRRRASATAS